MAEKKANAPEPNQPFPFDSTLTGSPGCPKINNQRPDLLRAGHYEINICHFGVFEVLINIFTPRAMPKVHPNITCITLATCMFLLSGCYKSSYEKSQQELERIKSSEIPGLVARNQELTKSNGELQRRINDYINNQIVPLRAENAMLKAELTALKNKPRRLKGQVFIATNSGDNIKLGAVPVLVIQRQVYLNELTRYLKESEVRAAKSMKEVEAASKEYQKLYDEIAPTNRALQELLDSEHNYLRIFEKAGGAIDDGEQPALNLDKYSGSVAFQRTVAITIDQTIANIIAKYNDSGYDKMESRLGVLLEKTKSIDSLLAVYQDPVYANSGLFEILARNSITSTTTDADGNYDLEMPNVNDILIIASARRAVQKTTDGYFWAISITPKDDRLQLDNNNDSSFPDGWMDIIEEISRCKASIDSGLDRQKRFLEFIPPKPYRLGLGM